MKSNNAYEYWKYSIKREIVFAKEYRQYMQDELLMTLIFKYPQPLIIKISKLSTTMDELKYLYNLTDMPFAVEIMKNGNIRIFNT